MGRIMRTNHNSLHRLVEIEKRSLSSAHPDYENNHLPNIAIREAIINSDNIDVANNIHNKNDQELFNEIDFFLDNQDLAFQETSNEIFKRDKRMHQFSQERSRNNVSETHVSDTLLQNTELTEEPSDRAKRLLVEYVPENTIRASRTALRKFCKFYVLSRKILDV